MSEDLDQADSGSKAPGKSEAAKRALAEAEERRRKLRLGEAPPELHGRGGLDPARYGDWEIKGLASDF